MCAIFLKNAGAERCRARHGAAPPQHDETVRGLVVPVNSSTERDRGILEAAVPETPRYAGGGMRGHVGQAAGESTRFIEIIKQGIVLGSGLQEIANIFCILHHLCSTPWVSAPLYCFRHASSIASSTHCCSRDSTCSAPFATLSWTPTDV